MNMRITFTPQDLAWFAALSGDYNPIHVDAEHARRLLGGAQVVHGVFTMLWALDHYAAQGGALPASMQVNFRRPVIVGETLQLGITLNGDETRLSIRRETEEVASILLQGTAAPSTLTIGSTNPARGTVAAHHFGELANASGSAALSFDAAALAPYFTYLPLWMGHAPLAVLMATSRIVGMECPGLHSLFTGLSARFDADIRDTALRWHVTRHTSPAAPLKIAVIGGGITAELTAMMRPPPVQQPNMEEVRNHVAPNAFASQKAIIIGGSRGLGELTAKIIAAGGGEVLITYMHGRADAEKVARDIGPACRILQLDVLSPAAIHALEPYRDWMTHLYYFATARIVKGSDTATADGFKAVYVTAFETFIRQLATAPRPLNVFYPSSVFVTERPAAFVAYADAKLAGEVVCARLTSEYPNVNILAERLPRLATDQTSSLLALNVPPALPVMLACITAMQQRSST